MKKFINLITLMITGIGILSYLYLVVFLKCNFSYLFVLVYFILLSLFNFLNGIIQDDKSVYYRNISIYAVLYFVLLISVTMFLNRAHVNLNFHVSTYYKNINLIPFKTILIYLSGKTSILSSVINLLGNMFVFIPLSFLIIIKDKNKNIAKVLRYVGFSVLMVEVLQLVLSTGFFDIDDFILNIGGVLLFIYIVYRFDLNLKLRGMFFRDFLVNEKLKYFAYFFSLLLSILVIIFACVFR